MTNCLYIDLGVGGGQMFSKERTMGTLFTTFPTDLKIGSTFSTWQVFSSLRRQQDACNHEKGLQ